MRSLLVAVVMVIIAGMAMPKGASAVGYYRVGEPPACSPLVARGIVPDTVNQLTEAFPLHYVVSALDSVAVDVRSFVEQMAQKPEAEVAAAAPSKSEAAAEIEQPAPPKPAPKAAKIQKKPVPVPKVTKDKKGPVKTTAKKKTTTTKPKTPPKPEPAQ
ncbi:MAG: hypothetical protein ACP5M0_13355 [Desulfomonilaceae bacterium]